MEARTRDRIVGGVFVVALAAIFIPMLFDETGGPTQEIEPMADVEIEPVPEIPLPNANLAIVKREELREMLDEDGFLVESGTRLGDVTLDANPDASDAWAVQLASFKEENRANALRERLQADGQRTWVSQAKIDGVLMTRVAVGPFIDRSEAEAFRGKAATKYELDAVLVGYRP